MQLFYKGHKFTIEGTGVATGIYIQDLSTKEEHVISRSGHIDGVNFADTIQARDELNYLIDTNQFKSIKQLPPYGDVRSLSEDVRKEVIY